MDRLDPAADTGGRFAPVDLLAAVGLTLALNAAVFVPALSATPLRIPLGALFVGLVPGYVVVAALFPERHRGEPGDDQSASPAPAVAAGGVTVTERLLLSVGLSVVVVPATGYLLNFTPWGVRLTPVLLAASGFTVAVAVVAALRRRRVEDAARFRPELPDWRAGGRSSGASGGSGALVNAVLVVAVLVFAASAGYAAVGLSPDQQYSEFYLLSPEGESFAGEADAPVVSAGDPQSVGVAVENHEGGPTNYTVVVVQQQVDRVGNETLVRDQTRLDRFSVSADRNETVVRDYEFTPAASAGDSRVVWLLYTDGAPASASTAAADYHVYLWVGASNASATERRALH